MAKKQSTEQKEIVGRVMHEWKHGELQGADGRTVRNLRQAIATALSEAGSSNQKTPAQNRRALRRTEAREQSGRARGNPTRAELYERAKRAGIPGRARMSKSELQSALDRS